MILERDEIREILRGHEMAVGVRRRLALDSLHSIQAGVGKRASCVVRVLDVWPHAVRREWVALVQIAAREVPVRYLRAGGGYTNEPAHALRDPESGHPEWSPPADWVDDGVERRAHATAKQQREDQRRAVSLGEQIDALIFEAHAMGEERYGFHIAAARTVIANFERRLARDRAEKSAA